MLSENLIQIYASSFRKNWDLPALTDYGTSNTLTYGDMARRIARTHLFFELMGIKPGDKIAVMGKNSVNWVVSYMSTITYGAVVVPVLQDFNPQDAQHIINHSDSRLLFVSDRIWEQLDFDAMPNLMASISLDNRHLLAEQPS
ncbi:MAG: AMP-binding protein, partial [Paramuribaculum sp.]|nr:AMP-binding protein [Paramuribaculum sp.]